MENKSISIYLSIYITHIMLIHVTVCSYYSYYINSCHCMFVLLILC